MRVRLDQSKTSNMMELKFSNNLICSRAFVSVPLLIRVWQGKAECAKGPTHKETQCKVRPPSFR